MGKTMFLISSSLTVQCDATIKRDSMLNVVSCVLSFSNAIRNLHSHAVPPSIFSSQWDEIDETPGRLQHPPNHVKRRSFNSSSIQPAPIYRGLVYYIIWSLGVIWKLPSHSSFTDSFQNRPYTIFFPLYFANYFSLRRLAAKSIN